MYLLFQFYWYESYGMIKILEFRKFTVTGGIITGKIELSVGSDALNYTA